MTNEEALKEAKRKLELAKMTSEQSVVEYYETVIEALEKQIPKKPIDVYRDECGYLYQWTCPTCKGNTIRKNFGEFIWNHHCRCGQKILWGDEE